MCCNCDGIPNPFSTSSLQRIYENRETHFLLRKNLKAFARVWSCVSRMGKQQQSLGWQQGAAATAADTIAPLIEADVSCPPPQLQQTLCHCNAPRQGLLYQPSAAKVPCSLHSCQCALLSTLMAAAVHQQPFASQLDTHRRWSAAVRQVKATGLTRQSTNTSSWCGS